MSSRLSLGAVTLAAPGDPLAICLESISGCLDEVAVFTWDGEQAEMALRYGARVIRIEETPYVEPLRERMQSALSTEWVLALDPDEAVETGAIAHFYGRIGRAAGEIAGFWIPHRLHFLGKNLHNSFPDVKQLRLFRRNRVAYSSIIHSSPEPVEGCFEHFADSEPGIAHHFVRSLEARMQRHLRWAQIEALQALERGATVHDMLDPARAALDELASYVVERHALHDGMHGVANAILHAWKSAAMALFLWELNGAREIPGPSEVEVVAALRQIRAAIGSDHAQSSLHDDR